MQQIVTREWQGASWNELNKLGGLVEQYRFDLAETFVQTLLLDMELPDG